MYRRINEETNDSYSRSSSVDEQSIHEEEPGTHKRKSHRVRSLVKSSVKKILETESISNTRRNSATSTIDRRPFPFGQCRVCMDKATGAHYGVPTCEGCKGFFKRSILRKEKYRCYFGDRCIVTTDNRNRCKSCRFRKCLKEGMSVEGVRMGRIPKLVKEKALAEHQLSSSSTENDDPSSSIPSPSHSLDFFSNEFDLQLIDEQFFLDEIDSISLSKLPSCTTHILPANFTIDETHPLNRSVLTDCLINCEEHFSSNVIQRIRTLVTKLSYAIVNTELGEEDASFIRYLQWKIIDISNRCNQRTKQLTERMKKMIQLGIINFPGDHSSLQDILAGLTDAIPFHVKNLITFAREIPAIKEIHSEDFQKIMNNRLFDFWLMKHAPLIRNDESYTMLPNGLQYTRQWMIKILGEEMVETMFDFANRFNALNFTPEEHALLFPVVICSKDNTLNDPETVEHIQYCYLYALYSQMLTTRTPSDAKTVFRSLLQILALLPFLNELQEKKIGSLIPDAMEFEP